MANLPSTKKTTTSTDVFDSYNTNESVTATTGEYDAVMGFFLQKTEKPCYFSLSKRQKKTT